MKRQAVAVFVIAAALVAGSASALIQDTDIHIVSAGRGPGASSTTWITTLYIYNPNGDQVTVQIFPFERNKENANAVPSSLTIPPNSEQVLDDVILNVFGKTQWFGAFRLLASKPIAALAAIYNVSPEGLFGHGVPGLPALLSVNPLLDVSKAQIFSVSQNATSRTNIFAVATDSDGAVFNLTVYNKNGVQVGSRSGLTLKPFEAKYWPLSDFVSGSLDEGFVEVVVTSGSVHFLGSRVNQATGDPLTLEPTLLAIRVRGM